MTGAKSHDRYKKYCIVHGHFYQPPRENAWLDIVERQESAAPSHDWNERITAQCYRANAYSRLLDPHGMIRSIYNNYRSMSFNFGPTLWRWLGQRHPDIIDRIIEGDRQSARRLSRHGNAIAQAYNHTILPLASRRDKLTQIRWARSFFQATFEREPEGMWLPETAINGETVECLAREGIRFVVLSPQQAEAVRGLDSGGRWSDVSSGSIDPRRPYRLYACEGGGKTDRPFVDVFFFDEVLSKDISFGDVLVDAHTLAKRLDACFDKDPAEQQVAVVATDGETFGHHKPFSDMCLSYYFTNLARGDGVLPVNFGWFLENFPPRWEVRLKNMEREGTAWSCSHGTGRWSRDCGCSTGGKPGWNQAWRAPLRTALEELQVRLDEAFEIGLKPVCADPWALRDAYIPAGENCATAETFGRFLAAHGCAVSTDRAQIMSIRRLLESQKYMQFAFTSCGWFFSDIGGIETVQNLSYACRALQLALPRPDRDAPLKRFIDRLASAKSNVANRSGQAIVEKHVLPYLPHCALMAFAGAIDRMLSREKPGEFTFCNYTFSIHGLFSRRLRHKEYTAFRVRCSNERTGEDHDLGILIERLAGARPTGYALPAGTLDDPGFDREDPAQWAAAADAVRMQMAGLFDRSKSTLARQFQKRMARETLALYSNWTRSHIAELDTISSLGRTVDPMLIAPIQHVTTARWNRTMRKLEGRGNEEPLFSKLSELWNRSNEFGFGIDYSFSVRLLEELLGAEMKHFASTLSQQSCDRMRYLLNIVDRFSVPVAKNRLEEIFHTILTHTVHDLYTEYMESGEYDRDRKTVLVRLANFARRMNFNTDNFRLDE